MDAKKMEAAKLGMSHAAPEDSSEEQSKIMAKMASLGAAQAGGCFARMALDLGVRGELAGLAIADLARMARDARKSFKGPEEHLEFMVWARGGLKAGDEAQGGKELGAGKAFAKAYAMMERDEWMDLLLTEPFFSSKGCLNASDMAGVVAKLDRAEKEESLRRESVKR